MNWKLTLLAAPLMALTLTPTVDAKDHWRKHSEHERHERRERMERQYRYNNGYGYNNNGYGYNNGYGNNGYYRQYPNGYYRTLPRGLDRNGNGIDDRVERQQYRYYRDYDPYYRR